jgi:hypothetical protein
MLRTSIKHHYKLNWRINYSNSVDKIIDSCKFHRALLKEWCPFFEQPIGEWKEQKNLQILRKDSNNQIELASISLPAFRKSFLDGPKG